MEKQYLYLADVAGQLPEIPKNSVLSQSVLKEDKLDVTLFRFDAKQELTEHSSLTRPSCRHWRGRQP